MRIGRGLASCLLLMGMVGLVYAIGEDPTPTPGIPAVTAGGAYTAVIVNDEGGTTRITGVLPITNVNVKQSSMRPMVILEDQTNFVNRDFFAGIPQNSQVLAHFTTDFYADAPVGYELFLPIAPDGTFNDVDHNATADEGVQVYQVGYWEDRYDPLYLDERDAYAWSSAYSSAKVDPDPRALGELTGGVLIVYARSAGQGFPNGFGADGKLFTADDPIVTLPVGYTLVNMDTNPFTFDRSAAPVVNLIEPESLILDDFSDMSYTEAFDALIAKARAEYSFTAFKQIDWDALSAEFRPRFEDADRRNDQQAYFDAIDAFGQRIPDGHIQVYGDPAVDDVRQDAIQGGVGLSIRALTDGAIVVNYVTEDSPAASEGIQVGATIVAVNSVPIDQWVAGIVPFLGPQSNAEQHRLAQINFALRFPLGTTVRLTYRNPGIERDTTAALTTTQEFESLSFGIAVVNGSLGDSPVENVVEFQFTPDNIGVIEVNSFQGNETLIVENWDYFINLANQVDAPAIIIDLRTNGGGFSAIGNRLAATLYREDVDLYSSESYSKEVDGFYSDPRAIDQIKVDPNAPYYGGDVYVLVGPSCASACEFFAYALTRNDRAQVVGQYGSYAIGGGWSPTYLPDGIEFALPTVRKLAPDGSIIVEGAGIQPTIRVPVTLENVASPDDVILAAALAAIRGE